MSSENQLSNPTLSNKSAVLLEQNQTFDAKNTYELKENFWKTEVKSITVQSVLVAEQAAKRLSNSHTKNRAEVSGSNRKPWKQKGTGRARHGSKRSPIWVGGGVTFGPTNQKNYHKKVNRKIYRKVLAGILSNAALENRIFVINQSLQMKKPATKLLMQQFNEWKMNPMQEKILWIDVKFDKNTKLSGQNIGKLKMTSIDQITVFDLLKANKLIIAIDVLALLEKRLLLC